jgi:hypothetical protein
MLFSSPIPRPTQTIRSAVVRSTSARAGAISSMSSILPNSRAEPTSNVDIRLESSGTDGASA